jgi:hypothetical protein
MNTRISLTRIATAAALAGCAFAGVHAPRATAQDDVTMSVDAGAPLSATLLPQVTITASARHPGAEPRLTVADDEPLPVTLLPTVRVNARLADLTTLLPVVRVFAQAPSAPSDEARMVAADEADALPRLESDGERTSSVRGRLMPR